LRVEQWSHPIDDELQDVVDGSEAGDPADGGIKRLLDRRRGRCWAHRGGMHLADQNSSASP
jgi:hypothetical protein